MGHDMVMNFTKDEQRKACEIVSEFDKNLASRLAEVLHRSYHTAIYMLPADGRRGACSIGKYEFECFVGAFDLEWLALPREAEEMDRVNRVRASNGLPPLGEQPATTENGGSDDG